MVSSIIEGIPIVDYVTKTGTMGDEQSQTCSDEYLLRANKCFTSFIEAVVSSENETIPSGFNTIITSEFKLMKTICQR
ncbi:hypothetical protein CHS0354_004553 [Potamilus streckersoni]|uniref:Uncharacterized protein n=1 Tax=Potamilus streckersoni TaxID=2493646 RepID=A0AAE0S5E5_9BIVA|nr:hypothetical protein CHS0354_004553 [Potamilus streckersoni]